MSETLHAIRSWLEVVELTFWKVNLSCDLAAILQVNDFGWDVFKFYIVYEPCKLSGHFEHSRVPIRSRQTIYVPLEPKFAELQ